MVEGDEKRFKEIMKKNRREARRSVGFLSTRRVGDGRVMGRGRRRGELKRCLGR